MLRLLYTILFYLATPYVLLRLWLKSKKNPGYKQRIKERFGYIPFRSHQSIWIHAVSLGETVAAIPLIEELLKNYPAYSIVLTNTTPTGSEKAKQQFGLRVQHCYFPYDLPSVWRRFFKAIQPKLILIMETELWPNLIYQAEKQHTPLILVNARLSDISIKEYAYLKPFMKTLLNKFKVIAAQSQLDEERFKTLGADPQKVLNMGNLKFDVKIADALVARSVTVRTQISQQPIWIAASTHKGEDEQILKIHADILKVHPQALLIIVPRHPERFDEVARLIESMGFNYLRKSANVLPKRDTQVFFGDTMGELQFYYALADVAFVGGTLVPIGGHNPLEALVLGKKVITGPNTQNAKQMYDELIAAGLAECLPDAEKVKAALLLAFAAPLEQKYIDAHMQKFQGVKARILDLIRTIKF